MRSPSRRSFELALFSALLAAVAPPTSDAQTTAPPGDTEVAVLRVADLGWLVGTWRGTAGEASIDEHWMVAEDGAMVGLFRWAREPAMYEILLLEDTPDGPVLRLRHYGPGLDAWEEKDAPVVFRPVEHGERRVLFREEGDAEEDTRLLYRHEDDGSLTVRLIERRDGADVSLEFSLRPAGR